MKRMYTKADLESAFNAGKAKRFDTGISIYNYFSDWFKKFKAK